MNSNRIIKDGLGGHLILASVLREGITVPTMVYIPASLGSASMPFDVILTNADLEFMKNWAYEFDVVPAIEIKE
jgi:hypothetical protein